MLLVPESQCYNTISNHIPSSIYEENFNKVQAHLTQKDAKSFYNVICESYNVLYFVCHNTCVISIKYANISINT